MNLRKRLAEWIYPQVVTENIVSRGLDRAFVFVKVDGDEKLVTVADLIRCYQKNAAADNRMREAVKTLRAAKSEEAQTKAEYKSMADAIDAEMIAILRTRPSLARSRNGMTS